VGHFSPKNEMPHFFNPEKKYTCQKNQETAIKAPKKPELNPWYLTKIIIINK
jgi:hypothetical protein